MKPICKFISTAGLLLVFASLLSGRSQAAWDDVDTSLFYSQYKLSHDLEMAEQRGDFARQNAILMEMRELTLGRENEITMYGIKEIDFHLRDLELAVNFTGEKLALAQEESAKQRQAKLSATRGDNRTAAETYKQALKLCEQLYGKKSHRAIIVRIELAHAIRRDATEIEQGVAVASDARATLEELEMTDFHCYLQTQIVLTRLYILLENHGKAIESCKLAIAQVDKRNIRASQTYTELTGLLASELNHEKQHEDALKYAMKGRIIRPTETGEHAEDYHRLLLESARAKMGMDQSEEAITDYELLIFATETGDDSKCAKESRRQYLKEYADVLKKIGNEDRSHVIENKIAQIKNDWWEVEQPTIEKSRYSN